MGKDLIFDPEFDLCGDDLDDDDPMEEFMCELEALLDVEIDEDTAKLVEEAVVFYFMVEGEE